MESLFPGLPDDVGWECLVRVELNSHHNVRCVCKSWNAALKSPRFYQQRKILNISEQRVCMLERVGRMGNIVVVYNPKRNSCKSLPPVPVDNRHIFHCHFVKQKLVLMADRYIDATRRFLVWLYDFVYSEWRQGAELPKWQKGAGFASAADEAEGLIYVGGGAIVPRCCRARRKPIFKASVYNVEEDKWYLLPDMNISMGRSRGAFANGKFFVTGHSSPTFEVFDTYARSWKTMEDRFDSLRFVTAFGHFYCLSGRGLIEYKYSQDKLHIVGSLPTEDWYQSINFAVVVSNKIFVNKEEPNGGQSFYILSPSSEIGGKLNLINIRRPSGLQYPAIEAVTVEF